MSGRRYRIPFSLPLAPGQLFARRRPFEVALGWPHHGIRYYYLARNAIWHGVQSIGLHAGDVVLVPAYCHGVEVDVLLARGLVPRYYRVDESLRIDFDHVRSLAGPGVRALYVIHYLGFPQSIPTIHALAREQGWAVIEDCALSLWSRAPEGPLGSFGDFSLFCLYKTLPVPHGGVLVLNRPRAPLPPEPATPDWASTAIYLAHRTLDFFELRWSSWGGHRLIALARSLGSRVKGGVRAQTIAIDTDRFELRFADLGVSRISRHLLDHLDAAAIVRRRRENFLHLRAALPPRVRPVFTDLPEGVCPLSYPIFVREKADVHDRLRAEGVATVNMWARFHPAIPGEQFPAAAFLRRHLLELPIHQSLENAHLDFIAERAGALAAWS